MAILRLTADLRIRLSILLLSVLPLALAPAVCAQTATSISLSSSPNPSQLSAPVVLTAAITPANVTGSVTFYDGMDLLGTAPVVSGKATLRIITIQPGRRNLRALFFGASNVSRSRSTPFRHTVAPLPAQAFQLGRRIDFLNAPPLLQSVVTADFNGDNFMDFALGYVRGFFVYLGRGDGTFLSAPNSPNRTSSISGKLAVGDFNQDGKPDLLADLGESFEVYPGIGDGSFDNTFSGQQPTTINQSLPLDYNSDGLIDVVSLGGNGSVRGTLGVGNGTFATDLISLGSRSFQFLPQANIQSEFAFGDFDNDGVPDVAVLGTEFRSGTANRSRLNVFLRGQRKSVDIPLPPAKSMVVGDLDSDGKDDIVMLSGSIEILRLFGNGDGTFTQSLYRPYNDFPLVTRSLALLDFDGDGVLDIAASRNSTATVCGPVRCEATPVQPPIVIVLGGKESPEAPSPRVRLLQGTTASSFQFADFDLDGRTDMIAIDSAGVKLYLGTNPASIRIDPPSATSQSTRAGTDFLNPIRVVVRDSSNNPLAGVPVEFSGPGQLQPSAVSLARPRPIVLTGLDGIASIPLTANPIAGGPYPFTASVAGLTPVSFSLTNTPGLTPSSVAVTTANQTFTPLEQVRFNITITPPAATGLVTVRNGSEILTTASVTAGGVASTSWVFPAGVQNLIFEYGGDATHNRSLASLSINVAATASTSPAIQSASSVVNGASLRDGLASGAWVTIYGSNLATSTRLWGSEDFTGNRLPTTLDGVRVTINNRPAFVYFISPGQINVLAPNDPTTGPVPVQITNANGSSNTVLVDKQALAPALFTYSLQQGRYAIAQDGTSFALVAPEGFFGTTLPTRPAQPGQLITLYATGLGDTNPPYPNGEIPSPAPLRIAAKVTIGGVEAKVSFAGLVGAGLYQLNVEVPNLPSGDARIVLTIGDVSATSVVYIPIQ